MNDQKNDQNFYESHITSLFAFFRGAKEAGDTGCMDGFQRTAIYWMQNLMAESAIPAAFKAEMLSKMADAGIDVPVWLHV